jgi:hypothetical protein
MRPRLERDRNAKQQLVFLFGTQMDRRKKLLTCLAAALVVVSSSAALDDDDFDDEEFTDRTWRSTTAAALHESLTSREFRAKYRVTKEVFDVILRLVSPTLRHGNSPIETHIQLSLFLRHCAHGTTHRELMVDYGLTSPQVHRCIHKTAKALSGLGLVKWPTKDQQEIFTMDFAKLQPAITGLARRSATARGLTLALFIY